MIKGVRGLADLGNGYALSNTDQRVIKRIGFSAYLDFRIQFYQDRYRWFPKAQDYAPDRPRPFYHVVLSFEAIQRYNLDDSDGTAEMLLGHCLQFALDAAVYESAFSGEVRALMDRADGPSRFANSWLFWGADRLRLLGRGFFPSMDDCHGMDGSILNLGPEFVDSDLGL